MNVEGKLPSLDLKARVLAAAEQQPSPVRRTVRLQIAALSVSAIIVPVLMFLGVGGVRQGPRSWALLAGTAGGALVLAMLAIWAVLHRGGRMSGPPRSFLIAITVACPVLFTLWKLLWSAEFRGMMIWWPTRPGLRCFALSFIFSLWPLLAFTFSRRGSDPSHPLTLGAALGAACGLWAATLVDLWCPVGHPLHVLLGHVLPIVLLGGVGTWVGARVLAIRSRQR